MPRSLFRFFTPVFALFLTLSVTQAEIYITEFMADNDGTLVDIDGDEPDWIELYNSSTNRVNLEGWYLSDTHTNLTQWAFPPVEIEPEGFLVVYASGKNQTTNSEIHTSFKLDAGGEELILTMPDGITIQEQYVFPELPEDASYGHPFFGGFENTVVLDSGAACTARVPTSSGDSIGWTSAEFNDSTWLSGTTGVGYDETEWWGNGVDYFNLIGLTLPVSGSTWRKTYPVSVYIRVPFSVTNVSEIHSLLLKMKYDDGFVAYLNGTPIQAANFSGTPTWNSVAGASHDDNQAILFEEFDITEYAELLQEGDNLLAIHGLNTRTSDNDLLYLPRIEVGYAGELDPATTGHLVTPTPGSVNSDVIYEGFVETPVVYPERGFYDQPVQITMSNATAGATIRYTTDGSEPTASSPIYSDPITLSNTTPLRVKAFIDGWKPSFSRTDTYFFLDDIIATPRSQEYINNNPIITGMDPDVLNKTYYDAEGNLCTVRDALLDIPTISVVTDNDNLFGVENGIYVNPAEDWEKAASIELINPDGSKGFQINSGLRIRGGWSRHDGYAKHAFRLFFRKSYGAGKLKYPLFEDEGVDEFDKMDLRTAQNYNWTVPTGDPPEKNTFLRDVFARDTAKEMGSAYTRSRYYHLYLNGVYWGIYMTDERPESSFAASYFGGDPADYDVVKSTSWRESPSQAVKANDGTLDAYNRLYQAAMNGFENNTDYFAVLGLDSNGQPDPTKEKLVDLNELMDYLLLIYYNGASDNNITVFLSNKLNNLYAVYNRENPDGFKWIQHDSEHSLDTSTQLDRTGPFTGSHLSQPEYFNPQTLHEKLLANAEYRIAFADRVYKHFTNNGVLTQARSEARMDARKVQIDRAIIANAARWGNTNLDRDTWAPILPFAPPHCGILDRHRRM
ncbi:MAG: CotH kinase family protein [Pontiellaceae bacterium]|nr:CotH kinase family protein [Pontiellaceae bacterium]